MKVSQLEPNRAVLATRLGLDGGVGDFRPWFEELKRLVPTK
jgi:hypothetical protein